ncbi:MAG TPA: FixH family protein [Paracoccaceae bacterium]
MAELTGRKVFAITVAAFTVIIGVNVVMAFKAVSTFPGLEVKNSYVASQTFDADRDAQLALGWALKTEYDPMAQALYLSFTDAAGLPAPVRDLTVLIGRTTAAQNDQRPVFTRELGVFAAPLALEPGKWMLQVEASSPEGTSFRQRIDLFVKG